ncbi:uncharacterized protein LOC114524744 isoform X2 [Dendronephthya gigantea]|uniref:uncharacterized protein LOC114524744 isoform X2 n=1 Tax=Dendronephthya gigantea TaxID=151771 RepID=UPI00106A1479|nr:uncharacterized protein LOC114524744 isoform X2 [Dendronephthya gigantea]
MVFNTVCPSEKVLNNFKNMSTYPPCKRGVSCPKCARRRSKEAIENPKCRSRRGTLLDAFRKAVNALDELDLVPRAKKARGCRHGPAALTIYVKRRTEKVYNAIRLNQKTVEELKRALGDKYSFAPSCVTSFTLMSSNSDCIQKRKRERITNSRTIRFMYNQRDQDLNVKAIE